MSDIPKIVGIFFAWNPPSFMERFFHSTREESFLSGKIILNEESAPSDGRIESACPFRGQELRRRMMLTHSFATQAAVNRPANSSPNHHRSSLQKHLIDLIMIVNKLNGYCSCTHARKMMISSVSTSYYSQETGSEQTSLRSNRIARSFFPLVTKLA